MDSGSSNSSLHIAMYPWFAFGHLIPYVQFANKLAERGHRISFLAPTKTQPNLQVYNLHPNLITLFPIDVPRVDGLPDGAETTADLPSSTLGPLLATAMDLTKDTIQLLLHDLKPHFVFFDFAHWMPRLARSLDIKSIQYSVVSAPTIGYCLTPSRVNDKTATTEAFMKPPAGFPIPTFHLHLHEARNLAERRKKLIFGSGVLFHERLFTSFSHSDALAIRGCREMDGPILDYIESQFEKPLLVAGPILPNSSSSGLDEKWDSWLGRLKAGSAIYCSFGSESSLRLDQFHELLLGFEMTGFPFLVAFKRPPGNESYALPEGFLERVEGRGIVHEGWVPQHKILEHPSVGCYVTHCGFGSLFEGLVTDCQLVLLPIAGDQIYNARLMDSHLKVGVEVRKGEEDGLFTKESVFRAVRTVMDENDEVGKEIRANRAKLRDLLLCTNYESCIDIFCQNLQDLLLQK